jgi:vacuolar protein sorting-associated protein 35
MFCHEKETKEIEFCCKIVSEFLTQAYLLMEDDIFDSKVQRRCLLQIIGSLLTIKSLSPKEYAAFATKTAQVAAKVVKRYEQCEMVALCSYLFFKQVSKLHFVNFEIDIFSHTMNQGTNGYCNPQRTLECLQRSIKLADTLTSSDPECVRLFVDLLESYVHFFEENNPVITEVFINGLITLTRENIESLKGLTGLNPRVSSDIHDHFSSVCLNIESKKRCHDTADRFAKIITSIDN